MKSKTQQNWRESTEWVGNALFIVPSALASSMAAVKTLSRAIAILLVGLQCRRFLWASEYFARETLRVTIFILHNLPP